MEERSLRVRNFKSWQSVAFNGTGREEGETQTAMTLGGAAVE